MTTQHDLHHQEFMIRSPCEITFHRMPFSVHNWMAEKLLRCQGGRNLLSGMPEKPFIEKVTGSVAALCYEASQEKCQGSQAPLAAGRCCRDHILQMLCTAGSQHWRDCMFLGLARRLCIWNSQEKPLPPPVSLQGPPLRKLNIMPSDKGEIF